MRILFAFWVACIVSSHCGTSTAVVQDGTGQQTNQLLTRLRRALDTTLPIGAVYVNSLNELLDSILSKIRYLGETYSLAVPVDNQTTSGNPVSMQTWNSKLYNITNVVRVGDLVNIDDDNNKQIIIKMTLKETNVEFVSDYNAAIKVGPTVSNTGVLTSDIDNVLADLSATIDFKHGNLTVDELYLSMPNPKGMKAKLSGNLQSSIANVAMPAISSMLQGPMLQNVGNILKDEFNRAIQAMIATMKEQLLDDNNA